jgi:hypothetical protein
MGQVYQPSGILLGNGTYIFSIGSDPNTADVATHATLATARLGSLALRFDTGAMYLKTAAATVTAPTGVWTAK